MKYLGIIAIAIILSACTAQQIQQAKQTIGGYLEESDELTADQVGAGLKEALVKGAGTSVSKASSTNGFFGNPAIKIPFPPDVQKVEDKLRSIGLGGEVDKFVKTLNQGAEQAAKEAKPILVSAIQGMSIQDAWGILKGGDNAATDYLKLKTSDQLTAKFKPIISKSLSNTNATKYYGDLINTYNKIPFVDDVNPDLEDYATERALRGLFMLVADQEAEIRKDPVARTTELLKRVFAEQD
ncbi:MAG: DUF4197 domain-containing protein [Cyclobacteriaceae bacterium]